MKNLMLQESEKFNLGLPYFIVGIITTILRAILSMDKEALVELDITNGSHLEELLAFSIFPLLCGITIALVNRDIFGKAFMWTMIILFLIGLIFPEFNTFFYELALYRLN